MHPNYLLPIAACTLCYHIIVEVCSLSQRCPVIAKY